MAETTWDQWVATSPMYYTAIVVVVAAVAAGVAYKYGKTKQPMRTAVMAASAVGVLGGLVYGYATYPPAEDPPPPPQ